MAQKIRASEFAALADRNGTDLYAAANLVRRPPKGKRGSTTVLRRDIPGITALSLGPRYRQMTDAARWHSPGDLVARLNAINHAPIRPQRSDVVVRGTSPRHHPRIGVDETARRGEHNGPKSRSARDRPR